MRGGEGVDTVNGSREHLYQSYAKEDSMSDHKTKLWGKEEWKKPKYNPTGQIVIHNATNHNMIGSNGEIVTLKIEGVHTNGTTFETKRTLRPDEWFTFPPPSNNNLYLPYPVKAGRAPLI